MPSKIFVYFLMIFNLGCGLQSQYYANKSKDRLSLWENDRLERLRLVAKQQLDQTFYFGRDSDNENRKIYVVCAQNVWMFQVITVAANLLRTECLPQNQQSDQELKKLAEQADTLFKITLFKAEDFIKGYAGLENKGWICAYAGAKQIKCD